MVDALPENRQYKHIKCANGIASRRPSIPDSRTPRVTIRTHAFTTGYTVFINISKIRRITIFNSLINTFIRNFNIENIQFVQRETEGSRMILMNRAI